jgi:hypothetical protein
MKDTDDRPTSAIPTRNPITVWYRKHLFVRILRAGPSRPMERRRLLAKFSWAARGETPIHQVTCG